MSDDGDHPDIKASREAIEEVLQDRPLIASLAALGHVTSLLLGTINDPEITEKFIKSLRASIVIAVREGIDVSEEPGSERETSH